MKVVDISAWQDEVDWEGLKNSGVEGVIIKIGEGSYLDEMFVEHVNHAVEYGLKYGVYYYARAWTEGMAIEEADIVARWLKEYLRGETPELGIWYDVEAQSMLNGDVTASCMAFLNRLTDFGHQYQGIYASWDWLSKEGSHYIDMDRLPDYVPYWTAQYYRENSLKEEYPNKIIRMWQYTDHYSDELPYDGDIYYEE